jgi:hypothetical protein
MIGEYLIVAGVLALAGGYIAIIHSLVNQVERRDLAALGFGPARRTRRKKKYNPPQSPNALLAQA